MALSDILQQLRLQNLFNPSTMGTDSIGSDSVPEPTFNIPMGPPADPALQPPNPAQVSTDSLQSSGMDRIGQMLSKIYNPEHTQQDKLNSMMSSYPNREAPEFQHKGFGGFLTKIAAIAGGLSGGPQMYNEVMDHKFNDKLADWKNQVPVVEHAAEVEKQSNVNERVMAMQSISDRLKEEAQQHKAAMDDINSKIKQQRADVYEFKAKNPGMKFNFSGPYVMVTDPIKGTVIPYTDSEGNKVETGKMSDMDKMVLGQENKLEAISAQGKQTQENMGVKHGYTTQEIEERGDEARKTKETPSGNITFNSGKPELPTQTRVRQFNKAREIFNSRPDLRPFIKINGTNDFSITPPGKTIFGGQSGPTEAQYKEMQDAIYGNTAPPMVPSHQTNTPSNNSGSGRSQAPIAPKGWKYVPKNGGGWTAVPDTGGQ